MLQRFPTHAFPKMLHERSRNTDFDELGRLVVLAEDKGSQSSSFVRTIDGDAFTRDIAVEIYDRDTFNDGKR
jgi:hypothetical protein